MSSTVAVKALPLVKQRLNRLDTTLDTYLQAVIDSAEAEMTSGSGAVVDAADDLMLLVDYSAWRYQNRDQPGGMPEWLRYRLRQRFIRIREVAP